MDRRRWRSLAASALIGSLLPAAAVAGPRYPTGLAPIDPQELRDIPVASLTRAYIPEAIDLSDRFPRPGRQTIPSDVSWATAYAARTSYNFVDGTATRDDPARIVSPSYLHNRITNPETCRTGNVKVTDALNFLKQKGVPPIATLGPNEMCVAGTPTPVNPPLFNIKGYSVVTVRPQGQTALADTDVDRVKQQLGNGHPVLFGMEVDEPFMAFTGTGVYSRNDEVRGSGPRDEHAMVIVGYDDHREAFRIFNSWGTDWGDGGFGWIGYNTFRANATSAWIIDTGTPPPKPTSNRPIVQGRSDFDVPCGDVRTRKLGGRTVVEGFVGKADDRQAIVDMLRLLHAGENPDIRIDVRPWPVCEALQTLAGPLAAASPPKLVTVSGATTVRFGSDLALSVTAPDYPSYLYLVYLQSDGKVVNLLPRDDHVRRQTPPNAVIKFGDGIDGRPKFRAGPPDGTEAVIAIASRSPVQELETLEADGGSYKVAAATWNPLDQTETPADRAFLSTLRRALMTRPDPAALQREVSAAVLHLKIEP